MSQLDDFLHSLEEYLTEERKTLFQKVLEARTRFLTIVLEDVYQPRNISACLRSCDCFGVQDVHIIEDRNPVKIDKEIALGAAQWLDLLRYNHQDETTPHAFETLRAQGYRLIGTSPHQHTFPLEACPLDQPTALVFGTEREGLTDSALEQLDGCLQIPMQGFTESMNVSVAVAVCLQHLTTKLRASEVSWQLSETEQFQLRLRWTWSVVRKHWRRLALKLQQDFDIPDEQIWAR